ncbi:MAG TPA: type IV pili methyl-accepting chemotaxis transducer N-terminal domain-containing protein, partial [Azonexus sp.]|nr:type IV pili methyl-accepting chemotaxis transducer N-terminal domain-containing protein [Azonexus sp.]
MAFGFKLPKAGAAGQGDSSASSGGSTAPTSEPGGALGKLPLPGFLANQPVIQQMKTVGAVFVVLLILIAALVYHDNRESTHGTAYIAASGEMRMLSQRLAKASSLALQGNPVAFAQLKESRDTFSQLLERLSAGGEVSGISVPASPDEVRPQLDALTQLWAAADKDAMTVIGQEKNLVALGKSVATIDNKNAVMLELTEQLATLKLQGGASVREIAVASQLAMLTQRIAKNASVLLVGDEISPEVAFLLGKDTNTFRDILQGLSKGSDTLRLSGSNDAESRAKLAELDVAFKEYQEAIASILGNMQPLVLSKQAGSRIFRESEELLKATDNLALGYQDGLSERALYVVLLIVMSLAALGTLALLAKIYLDDNTRRAQDAEKQRHASEQVNRENQDAILRLMNELGDLADGDLTVTATVSENITGAIADSINYTIEELRVLVGRINDAANRVTAATEIARQTSAQLLDAAERQSTEIQEAGQSALKMARSMSEVSGNAMQSAQVARQSLMAAEKGTVAVEDSIKGMNEIRNQIQETSK